MADKPKYEEQLQALLSRDVEEVPECPVVIDRLVLRFNVKGLTAKSIYRLRRQATRKVKADRTGETVESLDDEAFNSGLIVAGSDFPWGDSRLMDKYQTSTPDELVKRMLLAGELSNLGDKILELSGYDTSVEDVKNS